jgi:hypothetical protein
MKKWHVLLQGGDGQEWFALFCHCPILHQFILIELRPFKDDSQGALRKFATDDAGFDFEANAIGRLPRLHLGQTPVAWLLRAPRSSL